MTKYVMYTEIPPKRLEFLGPVAYEERKELILQQDHDDLMEMLYGAKK